MVSRLLGFVRDILLARLLGAGMMADAFFVALKLPNFFRRLFAEGTLSVALVPVLSEQRQAGEEQAHEFLNALAGLLLLALLVFTVLGVLFMPWLLWCFAPGFHDDAERWALSLELARWMFPYLALISLTAMAWAVLNAYRRFAVAAASPALLNIAIILAALWLAPLTDRPALALAWGVLLGGVLQLAVQFPALKAIGWVPKPTWNWQLPAIKKTLSLFGPAVLGVAAVQINILVGTILATLLPTGAVSYLYYADRIVQLPLALFAIAMGAALLPSLSDHFNRQDTASALNELRQGLAWLFWLTWPAVIGLWFLAEPIISTLFVQGKFTQSDAAATALALQAYSLGLIFFCISRVLATACFAAKDAKTPARYAIISVLVNIVLAIILMRFYGYMGLALATAMASMVNTLLLWLKLRRSYGSVLNSTALWRILRAVLASIPMGIALWLLPDYFAFPASGAMAQILWLGLAIGCAILLFTAMAIVFGERLQQGLKR